MVMHKIIRLIVRNFLIMLFVTSICIILAYPIYPQYSNDDIIYIEGELISVEYDYKTRGERIIKLDNGPYCRVGRDNGKKLDYKIGSYVKLGYKERPLGTSRDLYRVIVLNVDGFQYQTIDDVNKTNLYGYIFSYVVGFACFVLISIPNIIDLTSAIEERSRKKLKKKEKEGRKLKRQNLQNKE